MKINVRYFTEVGSDSTTMEIDELASWIKRRGFNISSIKEKSKSYSEEEVLEIIRQYALEEHLITSSKPYIWFEQFKKK
jgi:hypothetical protein